MIDELGGFRYLIDANYATLSSFKGIKQAKAIELLSIIEISKRLKNDNKNNMFLSCPKDIYLYLKDEMMLLKQEHFLILCLNHKNQLIKKKTLFIGTLDTSVVSPREVFKEAVGVSSAKIVLVHNHPSGDATPSKEDIFITSQFMELGDMMGIEVIDHIIVGWNEFYSVHSQQCFRE